MCAQYLKEEARQFGTQAFFFFPFLQSEMWGEWYQSDLAPVSLLTSHSTSIFPKQTGIKSLVKRKKRKAWLCLSLCFSYIFHCINSRHFGSWQHQGFKLCQFSRRGVSASWIPADGQGQLGAKEAKGAKDIIITQKSFPFSQRSLGCLRREMA